MLIEVGCSGEELIAHCLESMGKKVLREHEVVGVVVQDVLLANPDEIAAVRVRLGS